MIVMKFGGSSTASAQAIRQVAFLVRREVQRRPVVVVSAIGNTTDRLLHILKATALGQTGESQGEQRKLHEEHLSIVAELTQGSTGVDVAAGIQRIFRDLHVRMLEVGESQRALDAELKDWVVSMGEQLSSLIVAAAFQCLEIPTEHMDSRELIVTDSRFTEAKPKFWETYAKIRWSIPERRPEGAVVVGGFIGATPDGRTTTLGRGGSDLSASIIGAALNAEEIQVWKDVDGMLSCDPRLQQGGLCVKHLTFVEAATLAQSGAKILHPDTVAPARRLRIPIYLRNTFRPHAQGTRIDGEENNSAAGVVKSIACKKGLQLLRIRPSDSASSREEICLTVQESLQRQNVKATSLGQTDRDIVLAIEGQTDFSQLVFGFAGCLQVHLQSQQTLVTLVGERIAGAAAVERKLQKALTGLKGAVMLPTETGSCSLRVALADKDAAVFLERIHRALFAQADGSLFEAVEMEAQQASRDSASTITDSNRPTIYAGRLVLALAERSF